jgi:cell division protein FtsZ
VIEEVASPDAEIIFGAAIDESLGDEVKITVIATGFEPSATFQDHDYVEEEEPVEDYAAPAAEPQPVAPQQYLPHDARGNAFSGMPEVDTELPAFLRRNVTAR